MLFLAQWARKLSWKETAQSFRTSWKKAFQVVEWVIDWAMRGRASVARPHPMQRCTQVKAAH